MAAARAVNGGRQGVPPGLGKTLRMQGFYGIDEGPF